MAPRGSNRPMRVLIVALLLYRTLIQLVTLGPQMQNFLKMVGSVQIVRLGQAGWIGRGVMMLLLGWFVAQAAIQYDPEEANGIDGALRDATSSTLGAVLALLVAVGLLLYGLFCVISTPRARLTPAG